MTSDRQILLPAISSISLYLFSISCVLLLLFIYLLLNGQEERIFDDNNNGVILCALSKFDLFCSSFCTFTCIVYRVVTGCSVSTS